MLWGTDNLKTEGAPIGQALALLGAKPRFDSYGRLAGAELLPLAQLGRPRVDVVITLRLQNERMSGALLPSSHEFFQSFGLTPETLRWAKSDAIVMHPGPINRGVEINSEVADCGRSVILEQVTNGLAVRMAVLFLVNGGKGPLEVAH